MEARTCSTSEIAIFPSDTILYDTTQSIPGPHLLSRPEENVSNFESVNVKYGCPFRKRNPRRFNIREFQSCATNGFGDLPTLKRHIRTYHRRQPQNRCTAGQKEFESAEQPSEYPEMPTNQSRHIKESDDPEDGINDEIDEILAQRKSDLKVASWKGLWQVLFPNDHEILSSEFVPPKTVEIPEVFDIFDAILLHENAANSDTHIQNMNIDPPLQLQPFRTQLLTKLDALCQPNTETKSNNSLNTTSPFMLKSQPENLAISPTPSTASSLDPSSSVSERLNTRCYTCGFTFSNKRDLIRHTRTSRAHYEINPSYVCRCGRQNPRKDNFRRHIQNCQTTTQGTYKCRCERQFSVLAELDAHLKLCKNTHGPVGRPRSASKSKQDSP